MQWMILKHWKNVSSCLSDLAIFLSQFLLWEICIDIQLYQRYIKNPLVNILFDLLIWWNFFYSITNFISKIEWRNSALLVSLQQPSLLACVLFMKKFLFILCVHHFVRKTVITNRYKTWNTHDCLQYLVVFFLAAFSTFIVPSHRKSILSIYYCFSYSLNKLSCVNKILA